MHFCDVMFSYWQHVIEYLYCFTCDVDNRTLFFNAVRDLGEMERSVPS
jgi:hypothetical protein